MDGDRIRGLVYGMITDNEDPEGYGRVKAKLHREGEEIETDWLTIVIPPGANPDPSIEEFIIPNIGDMAIIAFIDGDPARGQVLGRLFGDARPNEAAHSKFIRSKSGYRIIMGGTKEQEKTRIFTPGGERYDVLSDCKNLFVDTDADVEITTKDKVTVKDGMISIRNENPNEKTEVTFKSSSNDIDRVKRKRKKVNRHGCKCLNHDFDKISRISLIEQEY